MMRILLAICLTLAAAWAGYWFIGSSAMKSGVAAWFNAREADGWVAGYDELTVQGFPSRFDTTLTAPRLSDPVTGLGWEAPFLQLMTLSYTPNHVIGIWPNTQRLSGPEGAYTLTSTDMRASLRVDASTALAPRRATLTAEGVSILAETAPEAEALSMAALRLAAERLEGAEARYHLGLAAQDLAPPASVMAMLDGAGGDAPPRVIESLFIDATADFTAPFDRAALEGARPQPVGIDLARASANWGAMALELSGALDIDASGMPEGDLTLTANGWRKMLQIARASGAITPDIAATAEQALTMMSGSDGSLNVPLRAAQGLIWLGPLPIAPAPVLRLQ